VTENRVNLRSGGFGSGLAVGLLVGVALAASVALSVAKAKPPIIDKVPQRPVQSAADAEKNRNWDPNSALSNKTPVRASQAPKSMENQ
jgi:hypothetical protein